MGTAVHERARRRLRTRGGGGALSPRDLALRLGDILGAVTEIRVARGDGTGDGQSDLQLAAIRYHLIVLGEAVHHLPDDLRKDPLWRPYLELRNHLAHECFRLEHARIIDLIGDPLDAIERAAIDLLHAG